MFVEICISEFERSEELDEDVGLHVFVFIVLAMSPPTTATKSYIDSLGPAKNIDRVGRGHSSSQSSTIRGLRG